MTMRIMGTDQSPDTDITKWTIADHAKIFSCLTFYPQYVEQDINKMSKPRAKTTTE